VIRNMVGWALILVLPTQICYAADSAQLIVTAQFEPTYSDWRAWRVQVYADGRVEQDWVLKNPRAGDPPQWSKHKTRHVSPDKLGGLLALASAQAFCDLKESYSASYEVRPNVHRVVTDQNTLVLNMVLPGCSHRVEIYGPNYVAGFAEPDSNYPYPEHPNQAEARRFLVLWSAFLALVPSPNPEETPEVYQPPTYSHE
jgi:hypothetical protein